MSDAGIGARVEAARLQHRMMDRAASMENVISLARDDPDLATPAAILEAAQDRASHPVKGDPVLGLSELRRAITHRYAEERWLDLDPERCILITNGAQEAVFLAALALVDPGDSVATHDPRYPAYDQAVGIAGGTVIPVPTLPEQDFALQADAVLEHARGAKILAFVNPNNPTGTYVADDGVQAVAEAACDMGMLIVSDETYADFVPEGTPYQSVGACKGMQEWTVTVGGFSMAYAMTGFRVGYLLGEPKLIRAAAALKAAISGPCPLFSQHAAIAAMEVKPDPRTAFREIYGRRRRTMMAGLEAIGIPYSRPGGGLHVWADVSAAGLQSGELCIRLLEETGVLILPGHSFGERWTSWVRLSLFTPDDQIAEALARVGRFMESL